MATIRFYGLTASLAQWRTVVATRVGAEGTAVQVESKRRKNPAGNFYLDERHYFDVELTDGQRSDLMTEWRAGWNERITYKEV
jgi:hypothetical protein